MRSLFSTILRWLQWVVAIVPKSARQSSVILRIFPYLVWMLVFAVAMVLGYYSDHILQHFGMKRPNAEKLGPYISNHWLGFLFFFAWTTLWLTVQLLRLLWSEDEVEFPDIVRAWTKGVSGLEEQGLDVRWLPVFLVNGFSNEEEQNFFAGSGIEWKVMAPPRSDRSAVLRFFANDDALFVSCTGVGALSAQRLHTAPTGRSGGGVLGTLFPGRRSKGGSSPQGTLEPGDQLSSSGSASGTLRPGGVKGSLAPAGQGSGILGTLMPRSRRPQSLRLEPTKHGLIRLSAREMDRYRRRMAYLARLVKEARQPYCPANGVLQSCPLGIDEEGGLSEQAQEMVGAATTVDLGVLHQLFGLQFPVTFFVPGLDKIDGFAAFTARCAPVGSSARDTRLGKQFPQGAMVETKTAEWVVNHSLYRIHGLVFDALKNDLDNPSNRSMFYFLCSLRANQERLASQLQRCFRFAEQAPADEPVRLSGWYLGAVGEGSAQQAFIQGALDKLIEEQSDIAWRRSERRRDRIARLTAFAFIILSIIVAVADGYFGYQFYHSEKTKSPQKSGPKQGSVSTAPFDRNPLSRCWSLARLSVDLPAGDSWHVR